MRSSWLASPTSHPTREAGGEATYRTGTRYRYHPTERRDRDLCPAAAGDHGPAPTSISRMPGRETYHTYTQSSIHLSFTKLDIIPVAGAAALPTQHAARFEFLTNLVHTDAEADALALATDSSGIHSISISDSNYRPSKYPRRLGIVFPLLVQLSTRQ
jgi:hypothetical protein